MLNNKEFIKQDQYQLITLIKDWFVILLLIFALVQCGSQFPANGGGDVPYFCELAAPNTGIGYYAEWPHAFDWIGIQNDRLVYKVTGNLNMKQLIDGNWVAQPLITQDSSRSVIAIPNSQKFIYDIAHGELRDNVFIYDVSTKEIQHVSEKAYSTNSSKDGTKLLFVLKEDHAGKSFTPMLYEVTAKEATPLSTKLDQMIPHAFSPDGTLVALTVERPKNKRDIEPTKLVIYNNETDSVEIPFEDKLGCQVDIDWASNSNQIVFTESVDGHSDIILFDYITGEITNISATSESEEFYPVFDPSGQYVAYVEASRAKVDRFERPIQEIVIVDLTSMERLRVTNSDTSQESRPKWSPDGNLLAIAARESESLRTFLEVIDLTTLERTRIGELD